FESCLSFCGIADTLTAIAISVGEDIFAFSVPRIATVETYRLTALRPVDTALFSPKLSPFIQTYIQNSVSPVLNPRAVLEQVYPQGHLY
ncbi:MAG: hypothetical protein VKL39_18110, partial [Leptolyngbyaceae bacterium]|nr:hypothetical protein [Leptolyngbyaceae bacterium]